MKYFAYGSNMNPRKMDELGIKFTERINATLKGYTLKFNKASSLNPEEGFANIIPDEKGLVEGVLYEISDSDLLKLDEYEGHPQHYRRITVKVETKKGELFDAVTYIASPDKIRNGLKPSKKYLKNLIVARDILPESYVRKLEMMETL